MTGVQTCALPIFNVLTLGKTPLTTILKLAWPTIIEQMMFTVLNFSDTAMVGALGAVATAAVGITSTSIWLSGSVISAVSVGLSIQLAQSVGAGNYGRAKKVIGQSLLTSLTVGILLAAVFFGLHWQLPLWLGAETAVVPHAQAYLQVISLSLLFNMLSSVFSSLLRCMGDTHTPLKYNFTAIILNIIFNFLFIFPSRNLTVFGLTFPMFGLGLGVAGAAWGTALSLAVSAILLLLSLCDKRREIHLSLQKEQLKPDREILKNMVFLGIPTAMEQFISTSGQVASTRIVSTLGTVAVAANTLAVSAESLSYMPAYGVSVATTTLVSQSIGADKKDDAMNFGKIANRLGFCAMIFVGVLLFLLAEPLIRLFTRDESVIPLAAAMLRIVAIAQPLNASYSILSGALRGAADVKSPFFIGVFGMWGLRVPLALLFVFVFHWGLHGYWIAMIIDNMTKGALTIFRFRQGKWMKNSSLGGVSES